MILPATCKDAQLALRMLRWTARRTKLVLVTIADVYKRGASVTGLAATTL